MASIKIDTVLDRVIGRLAEPGYLPTYPDEAAFELDVWIRADALGRNLRFDCLTSHTMNSVLGRIGIACVLVAWVVGHGVAVAQTSVSGSIRGVVSDEQGAILPGVTVEAKSPTVAGTFVAVSDVSGAYRLINLPPGEYTLTAELSGFSKMERAGILVRAGLNLTLDVGMKIGGMAETIEVKGETPMLDVSNPVQAVNIEGELQRNVPTSGRRDFTDFLEMTPGMNSYVSPSAGGGLYHMRGSRIESHVVQIDGADMSSLRQARPDYIGISTDTLEDAQVKSSVSDASAPLGNGAVMSIASPTGSNVIRGSASYSYTGREWNADNNPGGETNSQSLSLLDSSIGGPIRRDRAWVFGTYRYFDRDVGLGGRTAERVALAKSIHGSKWEPFDNAIKGSNYFAKATTQLGSHRVEGFYQYAQRLRLRIRRARSVGPGVVRVGQFGDDARRRLVE